MQQSQSKKPVHLKYQDKLKPKVFRANDKISQIVSIARTLFNLSDETNIKLKINEKILEDTDMSLEDLQVKGNEIIEIIGEIPPPQDLTEIYISFIDGDEPKILEWNTSLSQKVMEVKQAFCESQKLDWNLYDLVIDDKLIDENLKLNEIPNVDEIAFTLKKALSNPMMTDSNLELEEVKSEEKEIHFRLSKEEIYELDVNWLSKIKFLKPSIAQEIGISPDIIQRWSIGGKELDNEKPLNIQIEEMQDFIIDIENLTPFLIEIVSETTTTTKTINLDANRTIQSLKQEIELETKIPLKNQLWFLNDAKEHMQEDRKLLSYTQERQDIKIYIKNLSNAIIKQKSQIKKAYKLKYGDTVRNKGFPTDENIETVIKVAKNSFKIPEDVIISLKLDGQEQMDPNKSLDDYIDSNKSTERTIILISQGSDKELLLIFNDQQKSLRAKDTQTIRELRDQACLMLKVEPSYFYLLFLENQALNLTDLLKEVPNFDETSVLELRYGVEIKLVMESKNIEVKLFFNPDQKINDLKLVLLKEKLVEFKEFNLLIGEKILEEHFRLEDYIQNDDEKRITIREILQSSPQILFIFKTIPENKEFRISKANPKIDELKDLLQNKFGVIPILQVWMYKNTEISNQNELDAIVHQVDSGSDITIQFFEGLMPRDQDIRLVRHIGNKSTLEQIRVDLTLSLSEIKRKVAHKWSLPLETSQIWKIESKELEDDIPLAVHYKVFGRQDINVKIQNLKHIRFFIASVEKIVKVELDTAIGKLKKEFFSSKIVEIDPEKQLWSSNENLTDDLDEKLTLDYYLSSSEFPSIWIAKRVCKIKLNVCDIEANKTDKFNFEVNPETMISVLKDQAASKLKIASTDQCWVINNIESADDSLLKEYLKSYNKCLNIDVFIRKDFLFNVFQKENITMKLPLHLTISQVKSKLKTIYTNLEFQSIKLAVYQEILEESKYLKDYMQLWIQEPRPTISVIKIIKMMIVFKERQELFQFSSQATSLEIKNEIRKKFSLNDHEFELNKRDKLIDDNELEEIVRNQSQCVITCNKKKLVTLIYEDQNNIEEIIKTDSKTPLSSLRSRASQKLNISEDFCQIIRDKKACNNYSQTLDEIDPNLYQLKFIIQAYKEIEVENRDKIYHVQFTPSETVEHIRRKLRNEGFTDINKFYLVLDQQSLNDSQSLDSYGIFYGKCFLTTKLKKTITILMPHEDLKFEWGENLNTVKDLKIELENSTGIGFYEQILILMNDNHWQSRLENLNEKLENLSQGEKTQILVRKLNKIAIARGEGNVESLDGMSEASVQEHKKMFEIISKIPEAYQIWTLGPITSPKVLDDTKLIEDYGVKGFDKLNPIQIYRKIMLTVCLNERSETLLDIPTFETVGAQKSKIGKLLQISPQDQFWSYNDKELEDDKSLEIYFKPNEKTNTLPNPEGYAVDIIIKNDLEYFGFTDKNEININLFTNFFIESDGELDQIIEKISFTNKEGSLQFRNQLLGLFFGTLKKHSMWENLINKIKKCAFKVKGVNLWKSNERNKGNQYKFDTQFLLYYFLNSGSAELNVEILKIMKMHYPIPLVINLWTNRFSIDGTRILDEIYWVMQKSYVITSFGFGGADKKVYGKTELNNQVLFCKFAKYFEKNDICQRCPEILFDIYKNEKFPVNLIDMPAETEEKYFNKIIANSNMIIIHSLVDQDKTRHYLKKFPDVPKIVFYRDVKDAFLYVGSFRENLSNSLKNAFETNLFEIKVADLSDEDRSNELSEISSKVHEYILKTFLKTPEVELSKFLGFFENHNKNIHTILDKISDNSGHLINYIPVFSEIKRIERDEKIDEQAKQKELNKLYEGLKTKKLAPEITELMKLFITSEMLPQGNCRESPKLFLEKLQEYLRMMKSQQTKDFYKLYEFKSILSDPSINNEQETLQIFFAYWNIIKGQNDFYKNLNLPQTKERQQICEFIGDCIEVFEQKIIPSIFSIELFWRELIYFTNLNNDYQVQVNLKEGETSKEVSVQLFDFLVRLKKENILNGFPFEIIDGDLLHMPKEFFKTVFKGSNDRIIVISVLGPQSSGKSTLLNFLFGCNFITSSGRCTKGIYGTYFKVSNFNSCDGILVLDTEGLFGLLGKNEEEQRDKFDRKLVLFCLAMSDFVLINFKGDIDKNLAEVLLVCKDSLTKLQQGNIEIPEMFLILNQNTQTNMDTQLRDINKMGDLGFSRGNVEVLPLAFDTHTAESSFIDKFMDPLMTKTPKKEFSDKCRALAQKIFDKIKSNLDGKKQRSLENTMDRIEHLWELLGKFPDLIKFTRLEDFNQEREIKNWIQKEVDEKLKNQFSETVENYKMSSQIKPNCEQDFLDKFYEEEMILKKAFKNLFQEKTNISLFTEIENTLLSHINRIKNEILNELNYHSHQKKIKIYDIQGNESIREAAFRVRNQPNMKKIDKEKIFEETWKDIVNILAKSYDRQKESNNLFQVVKENYNTNLIPLGGVLPTTTFPQKTDVSFEEYKQFLVRVIGGYYVPKKAFEYTKHAPALIFKGGKSNIIFKYFNLKKYFEEETAEEFIGIPKSKFNEIFDICKLRLEIEKDFQEYYIAKRFLNKIQQKLSSIGIKIADHLLEKTLKHKKRNIFIRLFTDSFDSKEINHESCISDIGTIYKTDLDSGNNSYLHVDLIRLKHDDWRMYGTATFRYFFQYVINDCIKWDEVIKDLKKELVQKITSHNIMEIINLIKNDMQKLNLEFIDEHTLRKKFLLLCSKGFEDFHWDISNEVKESAIFNFFKGSEDISNQVFSYIKSEVLKKNLQWISEGARSQYFIVGKWKGKRLAVKKEFSNISWLVSYSKEETGKIFQDTTQNQPLLEFVFDNFSFNSLLTDIFDNCIANLQDFENWTYKKLYQKVTRETNDLIGVANNDLQQVSYRLEFKVVGHIHLAVIYLIWKYFEQNYWDKITQPLKTINDRKEQQKKYFYAVACCNHIQMNAVEAEKTKQQIQSYIEFDIVSKAKKDIIISTAQKFLTEMSREKIQDQIDAKYFSRGSEINSDDLYFYILNPHEALLKAYEEASKNYLQSIQTEIQKQKVELTNLLQTFLQRILSIQAIINSMGENYWSLDNLFEFKKFTNENEVLFKKYDSELGAVYYKIVLAILEGNREELLNTHMINQWTKVGTKLDDSFQISPLSNNEINKIIKFLHLHSGKVTNASLFFNNLKEQFSQLLLESGQLFEVKNEDIKEFQDKINIFICKQKCPCCDRICGIEEPTHKYHQCKYGHQIRAIGGVMLENKEASVTRCEDIEDIDKMQHNGQEMTWMEFKEKMKNQTNNPWIFDDISKTRGNTTIKERFKFAWTLIGKRICQERYKSTQMKYVEYNQAVIDSQKVRKIKPKNYIYMIDSSASMFGEKWQELLESLKKTLGQICILNAKSKVTILNFSDKVEVEYTNASPNSINIDALAFHGGGTNFEKAFSKGLEEIKKVTMDNIVLIFMTDGQDEYPTNSVKELKRYIKGLAIKLNGIKFDFNAIGFKCNSNILKDLTKDLGGTTYFADNATQLTKTFIEILNKQTD